MTSVSAECIVSPKAQLDECDAVAATIIERLKAVAPLIRDGVGEQEQNRRVSDETFELLRGTGALGISVPRQYGGTETSLKTMIDVSAAVAEIDGSAGWVTTLVNNSLWGLMLWPKDVQEEFYSDPRAAACGVFAPGGIATPVAGGYRVSGKWAYGSASVHSTLALVGVRVLDGNGDVVGIYLALIPRADYELQDTWHVAGMRGTGSGTIVADNVFVPAERLVDFGRTTDGSYLTEYPSSPLYRIGFIPMSVLTLAGPLLGLARAALDFVVSKANKRTIAYTNFTSQAESVGFQLEVAKAAAMIDTAHLHVYRAAGDIDDCAWRSEWPDEQLRVRLRSDTAVAVESVLSAVSNLVSAHGAGSFATVSPLQQIWRDVNAGGRHAIVTPALGHELYGKFLLGVENTITPLA